MKHFIYLIITTMLVGIIHAQTITQNNIARKYYTPQAMPIKANTPTGFYDTPNESSDSELRGLVGITNKLNSDNTFGFATQFVGSLLGESINTDDNGNLYAIRPIKLETEFDEPETKNLQKCINNKCEQYDNENKLNITVMETSTSNPNGYTGPVLPYNVSIEGNSTGHKLNIQPLVNFKNATIALYNTTGKIIVLKANINGTNFSTNISEFAEGIYWLEICESDNVCIQKVWKKKE